MVNRLALHVVSLVLSFINVISHALGVSLLCSMDSSFKSPQQLMIINLSFAELINSFIRAIIIIIHMLPPPYMPKFPPMPPPKGPPGSNMTGPPKRPPLTDAQLADHYLITFSMTGFFFVIFLIMMAITLDRVLVVLLKSSYNRVCSTFNTKILLGCIWVIGIAMLIGFPLGHHINKYDHRYHFEYHIYLVTDVVFMVFAIACFLVVVLKYRDYELYTETDSNGKRDSDSTNRQSLSCLRMLSNATFYIPLLIMFTYFVFIILPHWVYIGKKYAEESRSMDHWAAVMILLLLGYWSDAIVYIFLQAPVRKLLWRWLGCGYRMVDEGQAYGPSIVTINSVI